jgi:hypothetical protein
MTMNIKRPEPGLYVADERLHAAFSSLAPFSPLPWNTNEIDPRIVEDASGASVCKATSIAAAGMIITAVNTCGGFQMSTTDKR